MNGTRDMGRSLGQAPEAADSPRLDGGALIGRILGQQRVEYLFTVNGGHIWPILSRLRENGILAAVSFVGTIQFSQYTLGAEQLKESLEQLVRTEQLDGQVHWLGYRGSMERVMASFDVLVCPSVNEPFGRVIIEAMACGVPVVAARSGGIPEIITHGEDGLLFPPHDEVALADCLRQLLTDTVLRRTIAEQARITVERRFSLKTLAGAMERVYERVLREE